MLNEREVSVECNLRWNWDCMYLCVVRFCGTFFQFILLGLAGCAGEDGGGVGWQGEKLSDVKGCAGDDGASEW